MPLISEIVPVIPLCALVTDVAANLIFVVAGVAVIAEIGT